ncbi:putative SET domain-containing protein [Seiridium cardinale]|uniref:SET domain-containing protein n=1 Tax=Seiridium cardinale TaxID=138064 RepID=A0ABR2XKP0_9PEZI
MPPQTSAIFGEPVIQDGNVLFREYRSIANINGSLLGRENNNKLSRRDIEQLFSSGKVFPKLKDRIDGSNVDLRPWIRGPLTYPPSSDRVNKLPRINLSDLRVSIHHRGSAIVLRIFTEPNFDRYLCAGVEDEVGNVDLIILFNTDPKLSPDYVLTKGLVLAIKNPLYLLLPNGRHGIVVEHPCDLVEIDLTNTLMPTIWRDDFVTLHSAEASCLNREAKDALIAGNHISATRLYTMALSVVTDDQLRSDLLRGRAQANICVGRFEQARHDALASMVPHQSKSIDAEAFFRAGCASYQSNLFSQALEHFDACIKTGSAGEHGGYQREQDRTRARLKEMETGEYDFERISTSLRPGSARVDAASFILNTEIKNFDYGKRGLIATKDMKMGDFILCEKASCASFEHDMPHHSSTNFVAHLDYSHPRLYSDAMARLTNMVIQKTLHDSAGAKKVFSLRSPQPQEMDRSVSMVDGQVRVNSFMVQLLLQPNQINLGKIRTTDGHPTFLTNVKAEILNTSTAGASAGLFTRASLVNHSCIPNAARSFLGDLIVLRAAKDIKKGQEITLAYVSRNFPGLNLKTLQEMITEGFGFSCKCGLCEADKHCTSKTLASRSALVNELIHEIISSFPLANMASPRMAKIGRLRSSIEKTYTSSEYQHLPRPGLIEAYVMCASAGGENLSKSKAGVLLNDAIRCLQVTGLMVELDENTETLQLYPSAYMPSWFEVDAAILASRACRRRKKKVLSAEFMNLAKLPWKIQNGTDVGFKEKFGDALKR